MPNVPKSSQVPDKSFTDLNKAQTISILSGARNNFASQVDAEIKNIIDDKIKQILATL